MEPGRVRSNVGRQTLLSNHVRWQQHLQKLVRDEGPVGGPQGAGSQSRSRGSLSPVDPPGPRRTSDLLSSAMTGLSIAVSASIIANVTLQTILYHFLLCFNQYSVGKHILIVQEHPVKYGLSTQGIDIGRLKL